ncbi:hypothetical protein BC830DRAFT_1164633 [Chytriomyces sp. MP71]|nr:hypothetical protein BC830DRAFT_1164633 [Chytriomyces sp. MP71]
MSASATSNGTATTAGAEPEALNYNLSNVLTNFFRGLQMGVAILLFILALFVRRLFAKSAIAITILIALITIAMELVSISYDILLMQDCYFRVKLIYSSFCVVTIAYSLFLGDLTYRVSQSYSKTIPGTFYIIVFVLCIRVASAIFIVYSFTWKRGLNLVCSSVLNPQINLVDKFVELCFSLILSTLFLYPVVLGYRDITRYSSNTEGASARGAVDAGRSWLLQVIRDQGFLSVVTCLVQIVYVLCVFTGGDPSLVSLWNGIFAGEYLFFLSIHLITTVMRKVGEAHRMPHATVVKGPTV